jgi:hypothetical protein
LKKNNDSLEINLPQEIWGSIFEFLPLSSHLNIHLTSKLFHTALYNATHREFVIGNEKVTLFVYEGKAYISLLNNNFSTYELPTRGGWKPGDSTMVTKWYKIRFDPKTMIVHNGDFTFSK